MARLKKPRPAITFVVDSREQAPFRFTPPARRDLDPADPLTATEGLAEGDYAVRLAGDLLPIRIERKSLSDLFGVCGHGRERFERELERLTQHTRIALIIEASAQDILDGYERSQISGRAALSSVMSWWSRYGIAPIFAGNRRMARALCQRALEEFAADWGGT